MPKTIFETGLSLITCLIFMSVLLHVKIGKNGINWFVRTPKNNMRSIFDESHLKELLDDHLGAEVSGWLESQDYSNELEDAIDGFIGDLIIPDQDSAFEPFETRLGFRIRVLKSRLLRSCLTNIGLNDDGVWGRKPATCR